MTPAKTPFESARKAAVLVYVLQALSLIVGVTAIIGVIVDYVKRSDARGTWLESHYTWQIRTFWYYLLLVLAASLTLIVGIGYVVFFAAGLWYIYRFVKGWLRLRDERAMYEPKVTP